MRYLNKMQHLLSTSLPGLLLASLLSATPSLAAAQSVSSEATEWEKSNLTLSQSIQIRMLSFPNRRQGSSTRVRRQRSPQVAPRQINENLLNRRSNESYEAWYSRIDPLIMRMPKRQYQAWKATLFPQDQAAFDAITRRRNYEARERMNQLIPLAIEEALTQPDRDIRGRSQVGNCHGDPKTGRVFCGPSR